MAMGDQWYSWYQWSVSYGRNSRVRLYMYSPVQYVKTTIIHYVYDAEIVPEDPPDSDDTEDPSDVDSTLYFQP